MIHELIDSKKKSKSNGNKNGKQLWDNIDTWSGEQSGSEWSTAPFIPPWLKSNLGLNLKNYRNLDWSARFSNFTGLVQGAFDQKSEKICSDSNNQNQCEQNESEELKSHVEDEISKKSNNYFETPQREFEEETLIQTSDVESNRTLPTVEKENPEEINIGRKIPVIWQVKPKVPEIESSSTDSELNAPTPRKKAIRTAETKVRTDCKQVKNEERKRLKTPKKRHKTKQRVSVGHTSSFGEVDVDYLLEKKAKEILEDYAKKKVHSAASDIKRFEAKLILLHIKFSLGKLTPDDMRLLHEIKTQAGSKENFDKLIRHVREVNLKEILETQNCLLKPEQKSKDKDDVKSQSREEERILASTDDEDDVKHFSELLNKNQNEEEKRKCLEEVRNYFDRKRRTRLTKCWLNTHSKENDLKGREECKNEKAKTLSDKPASDWKSKFRISDKEIVGKAVNETLQKFVELYHFNVTPSIMSSVKNNVLKGIQTHSFEGGIGFKKRRHVHHIEEGDKLCNSTSAEQQNKIKDCLTRKSSLRDLKNMKEVISESRFTEINPVEIDKIKKIKTELEHFINAGSGDTTRLKVQSVILKEDIQDSCDNNMEFTYSFTKKCLEPKQSNIIAQKDIEVQVGMTSSTINADTQTQKMMNGYEKYIQTKKNPQKSVDIQTEGTFAIELKKLIESDVSTGLYRMVRSKQAGRFYLYPEDDAQNHNTATEEQKDENKIAPKNSDPIEKERETNASEIVIVDDAIKEINQDSIPDSQRCVWLWDGKKINSGDDLKPHVESLFEEKLQEIRRSYHESGNDRNYNSAKAHRTDCHDNMEFTVLHPALPFGNVSGSMSLNDTFAMFGEESLAKLQSEELAFSGGRFRKDASTQNSEQAFLSLNVKREKSSGKSQHSSKTTFVKRKQKVKLKRDRQMRHSTTDLKKAVQLMTECLSYKGMKFEVDNSLKDSLCNSGTTLDSNLSSCTKDTNDDHVTMAYGVKDRNSRMIDVEVQTNSGSNLKIINQGLMNNHKQWELIESVLRRVNRKERESLWNDVRELIKSKIGKDINNENAKEVCIQIEQDLRGTSQGEGKKLVLAKGYYSGSEGDVEVEIDLTLNDLESIIRRREKNWRRRNLRYRRKSKVLRSSSSGHTKRNKQEQVQRILKTVSKSRPSALYRDVRCIKPKKDNSTAFAS